jgi:hypothetical protein
LRQASIGGQCTQYLHLNFRCDVFAEVAGLVISAVMLLKNGSAIPMLYLREKNLRASGKY